MIRKVKITQLRNAEHLQFVTDSEKVLRTHLLELDALSSVYDNYTRLGKAEETAMAVELRNEKVKLKNEAEYYRDRLHGKLFNYVKAILYDEADPQFDAARRVMEVIKSVGNPTRLSENAETAMLTTLGNKLAPYTADLESIGAQSHLYKLMEANQKFSQLEAECRNIASERAQTGLPSVSTIRKEIDPVYRKIVDTFNVFILLHGEESYKALIADLNTLTDKYNTLISQHKAVKKEDDKTEENAIQ
jgi:hypothetical protein